MKCLVLSRQQMYLKGSVLLGQIPQSILLVTSYHRTCWLHSELLFTRSVMSDTLWPHGLQYTRLPCPSPTPGACLNSCPLSQWCHPPISFSVVPFSFCLQSFPASRSFPMSLLFASGGQSIGASSPASVFPMNIQGWFPLGLTGFISWLSGYVLK